MGRICTIWRKAINKLLTIDYKHRRRCNCMQIVLQMEWSRYIPYFLVCGFRFASRKRLGFSPIPEQHFIWSGNNQQLIGRMKSQRWDDAATRVRVPHLTATTLQYNERCAMHLGYIHTRAWSLIANDGFQKNATISALTRKSHMRTWPPRQPLASKSFDEGWKATVHGVRGCPARTWIHFPLFASVTRTVWSPCVDANSFLQNIIIRSNIYFEGRYGASRLRHLCNNRHCLNYTWL